ncbi:MAG: hypothetical protein C0623_12075 [Desulfuromonas sp.]|nr:MAG: hypothetical protein C0623_12075 [Desulfuromonas sp.]
MSPKDYADFINFKKRERELNDYQAEQRIKGRKDDAGPDFFARRQTLVMRRADVEELAPDDDVLAYVDIHALKKAKMIADDTYEDKKTKIIVSDEEIKAFRDLENEDHYFKDITLEMVNARVEQNKAQPETEPAESAAA